MSDDAPLVRHGLAPPAPAATTECATAGLPSTDHGMPWKFILPLAPGARVLDVGCGSGEVSRCVAPHVAWLCTLDRDIARLRGNARAGAQDTYAERISPLAAALGGHLPFRDDAFDLVLISAGLDSLINLGGHRPPDDPARFLLGALREIRRVLKPDGCLVLTARNRLREAASAWPRMHLTLGLSLMSLPPSLSRRIAKRFGTRGGDTWVLGYHGYRRLMREAGLPAVAAFGLSPGIEPCLEAFPLAGPWPSWATVRGRGVRERLRRSAMFAPALGFLAGARQAGARGILDDVIGAIEQQIGGRPGSARITGFLATGKNKCIVFVDLETRPVVVKLPLSPAAVAGESRNHAIIRHARTAVGDPAMVPAPLAMGAVQNAPYFVEEKVCGQSLRSMLLRHGRTTFLDQVAALWRALNPSLREHPQRPLAGAFYRAKVEDPLRKVLAVLDDPGLQEAGQALFRELLYGVPVRPGLLHGTFTPYNIMARDGAVTGLLDWEDGEPDGVPIIDAMYYLESCERMFERVPLAETISRLARGPWGTARETSFLEDAYDHAGLSMDHHVGFTCLYWVHHVHSQVDYQLSQDRTAAELRVADVLRRLLARQ